MPSQSTPPQKLTTRSLERLAQSEITSDVYDTEIPGLHVRLGKRGLVFRLGYKSLSGKNTTLTIGRYGLLSATQARSAAKEALGIILSGGDPRAILKAKKAEAGQQEAQTLESYLRGPYAEYQQRRKDGAGTIARIHRDFSNWLQKPMEKLTRQDVENWQTYQEKKSPPNSFETLKRSYGALKALLSHASKRGVISENPLSDVNLQKPAWKEEESSNLGSERRYLEAEEVTRFFIGLDRYQEERRQQRKNSRAHGKSFLPILDGTEYVDHVKPWLLIMFYTGFRPGDLYGLMWEHVDLKSATIRKTIEKTAHHTPDPRTFPLCQQASRILTSWWQQQGSPKKGLVFPSPRNGKRLASSAMRKPWAKIKNLGELPDELVMYTLRHNFASQLVMGGVDLLTVSQLMAHSSIETTIKFYGHLAPDHKRDAVEVFASRAAV